MTNTHNLPRLATLLAIPAVIYLRGGVPATAHPTVRQNVQLLTQLRQMAAASVAMPASLGSTQARHQRQARQSAQVVGEFARKARPEARYNPEQDPIFSNGDEACGNPGTLYLSTGFTLVNYGQGSIPLTIEGNLGKQSLTFASGTSMNNIIAAINTFDRQTGVKAGLSDENPRWVELNSVKNGEEQFVRVTELEGDNPIIYTDINDPQASFGEVDYGDGIRGDFNCDGKRDAKDLVALIETWGQCRGCPEDLDESWIVDVDDLRLFIDLWKGNQPHRPLGSKRR